MPSIHRHDNHVACADETIATGLRALDLAMRTADAKPDRHRPAAIAKSESIDPSAIRRALVPVTDLDLSTSEGRRVAQDRVRAMADRLRWQETNGVHPGLIEGYRACVDQALADAARQTVPPAQFATRGDVSAPNHEP